MSITPDLATNMCTHATSDVNNAISVKPRLCFQDQDHTKINQDTNGMEHYHQWKVADCKTKNVIKLYPTINANQQHFAEQA